MLANINTSIGNLKLNGCIMNASGVNCTLKSELLELEASECSAIVSKSCTFDPRIGNDKPRVYMNDFGSVNSSGLPNMGYKFYKDLKFNKPYIMSVANINEDHTLKILDSIQDNTNIDLIELNVSCPNVKGSTFINLRRVYEKFNMPIGLKLQPYFYDFQIEEAVEITKKYPIKFITCVNSIPNALIINPLEETPVLKPNSGLGGLGGEYIRPIGLSNVYRFRKLLPSCVDVIGCGGISTGEHVFEYILAGASAVQVGTALLRSGTGIFQQLNDQLRDEMTKKGYTNISSFCGTIRSV